MVQGPFRVLHKHGPALDRHHIDLIRADREREPLAFPRRHGLDRPLLSKGKSAIPKNAYHHHHHRQELIGHLPVHFRNLLDLLNTERSTLEKWSRQRETPAKETPSIGWTL